MANYWAREQAWYLREQYTTAQYQTGWVQGQANLVAALLQGRQTIEDAVAYLDSVPRRRRRHPYDAGWHDGQVDLINALHDGRVTLKAAAVKLGLALESEL
jgi:hypothetical protein